MISVIVPCYNSTHMLNCLIEETRAVFAKIGVTEYEFVLVNDCSPNPESCERILKLGKENSDIKVIDLAKNTGQANAQLTALNYAEGDIMAIVFPAAAFLYIIEKRQCTLQTEMSLYILECPMYPVHMLGCLVLLFNKHAHGFPYIITVQSFIEHVLQLQSDYLFYKEPVLEAMEQASREHLRFLHRVGNRHLLACPA